MSTNTERARIFAEIDRERDNQDAQWGGDSHDDGHGYAEWRAFRLKFEDRIHEVGWRSPFDGAAWLKVARASLIKIAALTVAQIESFDRATPTESNPHG